MGAAHEWMQHKAVVHGSRIYLWGGFGPATSKPASTTTTPAAPATTTTITTNGADESGDESEQEEEDDSISFTWCEVEECGTSSAQPESLEISGSLPQRHMPMLSADMVCLQGQVCWPKATCMLERSSAKHTRFTQGAWFPRPCYLGCC